LGTQPPPAAAAWRARTVIGLVFGGLWFIVLIGVLFVMTEAPARAMTGIALVAGVIGVVFAQIKYPRVAPRHGQTIMVLLLTADILLTFALGVFGYYRTHRPIDVTARVMLDGNHAVRPGQHAVLDVAITESRPRLDVLFRVSDHNPLTSNCAPLTALSITPVQGGNSGVPVTADDGGHVVVPVLVDTRNLHLEIEVRNAHNDKGCEVDLAVTSARLIS
jgi:hypothetical protein